MRIIIQLGETDRARLGAPEVLTYDPAKVMAREAALLRKVTGWSLERLGEGLQGTPVLDEAGAPVLDDDEQPRVEHDPEALIVMVWLALLRSGMTTRYADVDFDLAELQVDYDDEGADPGKGSTPATTSTG